MNKPNQQKRFSVEKALAIITAECNIIYITNKSGSEINKFYVSIRLIVESTLRIIIYKNNPNTDPSKETFANLITHIRLVPEFNKSFNSFLFDAKKLGNNDAHDLNENLQFRIYRDKLYEYLEWFFTSILKQDLPAILISWYNEYIINNASRNKIAYTNIEASKESEKTRESSQDKKDSDRQNLELLLVKDKKEGPEFPNNINCSSETKNDNIDFVNPTRSDVNELVLRSQNENSSKTEWEEYLKSRLEKYKQEEKLSKERKKRDFDAETIKLKELIRPVTGNIISDFFMLPKLKDTIKINGNKIIIDKTTGEIIFDLSEHIVYEKHILKFRRTINYKDIIKKNLSESLENTSTKIRFSSINIYVGNDKWSCLNFEIGKEVFKAKYIGSTREHTFTNVYLFFCYLLAYMSGIDIYKIVNIEDLRRSKWNDTPSINLKYLNEPDSLKQDLETLKKKLNNELWDEYDELRKANTQLGNLSSNNKTGIKELKDKINRLANEYASIQRNLDNAIIRASRTSKEFE